ncbi:MAG: YwbE family protein [Veillonellaceae bacterium]|nr:YwbE family protein [Veillonellaceae bacterium]
MPHTQRKNIAPGLPVQVVQKQHQRTGQLTEGVVKDILTSSPVHSRGIKVRLESGVVGRVQRILTPPQGG